MKYVGKMSLSFALVLILFFGFAVTSTYAATVGQAIASPESGWQRYDDRYVKSTMARGKSEAYYQSTGTSTQEVGKNIKFQFYGRDIRLLTYSSTKDHASEVSVKIDGVPYQYSEAYNVGTLTLVFEKTGLEEGLHDVLIESVQAGKYTSLDAIDIDDDGYIVPMNTPAQLKAISGNAQATLSWNEIEEASGYTVYFGTEAGKYTEKVSVTKDAYGNYVVPGLTNGTTYYFVVTATVSGVESERSNEASATPNGGEQPNPEPEQPSGNRAILVVTMTTGLEKEFDLSMKEVNAFIAWYEAKQAGSGKASYAIDKHDNNKGPFTSRKDYILYDRVLTFEVSEY